MIGFRISEVCYKNFGPFEDVSFDFAQPGLTVIEGLIEGKRGCDSNGAGKSFLFDGVAWALYGRCIRERYKGDDVVRLNSKSGCAVTVQIIFGKEPITVTRYRKHPIHENHVKLYVGKKDRSRGTDPATTAAIEALLGMDFTSFCNSVAFGVREDIKSFFSATDVDRKRILERILGLELYAEAEKVARRKLREVTEDLEQINLRRTELQTSMSEKQSLRTELIQSDETHDVTFKASLRKLAAKKLRGAVIRLDEELSRLREEWAIEETNFGKLQQTYKVAQQEYLDAVSTLDRKERKLEVQRSELTGSRSVAAGRIVKFEKLGGKKCPTCTQPVSGKLVAKVRKEAKDEIKDYDAKIDELRAKIAVLVDKREDLEVEPPEEPSRPIELDTLNIEINTAQGAYAEAARRAEVEEARVEEMEEAAARIRAETEDLERGVALCRVELAEREEDYQIATKLSDDLTFWIEGFGNQGLKSFLIEAEIPAINKRASAYAQQLLGAGAVVRLTATSKLKTKAVTKEKLSVEGAIPGCTKSYAGASRGQKKRMDLALLLAFREIVAERQAKAFDQLFADEMFDGVDRSGVESIAELLKDIAAVCPVALVTHDSRLKPIAERLILVHHDGSRAVLEGGDPIPSKTPKVKKKAKKTAKHAK